MFNSLRIRTKVLVVARPPVTDKKGASGLTTIYMPITEAEIAEIKRLDDQAQDE